MVPVTILHTRDGELDAADQSKLKALADRIAGKDVQVLLHLHGGLVNNGKGDELANRLSTPGKLSFNAPPDWEQVYVVWRTGVLETISANWIDLASNDRLYKALLKRLMGYLASKLRLADGSGRSAGSALGLSPAEIDARLRSGSDAPFADIDVRLAEGRPAGRGADVQTTSDAIIELEFRTGLQMDAEFTAAVEDLDAALNPVRLGRGGTSGKGDEADGRRMLERIDGSVRQELESEVPAALGRGVFTSAALMKKVVEHGVKIALRVIKRFRADRDHGFHATIVEELARELYGDLVGASIWGMMKKDGFDHFEADGLGPKLVEAFSAAKSARLRVTAHSAGSIWATALLQYLAKSQSNLKFEAAFLAPAVRVSDFAAMLKDAESRIDRFRIYAMSDAWERADPVIGKGYGFIYPSSLLYIVSGLFEETKHDAAVDAPILGMARFFPNLQAASFVTEPAEQTALKAAVAYLAKIPNSTCYAPVDGGDGLRTQANSHGAFDSEETTLASVAFFLK